MNLAIDIGNTSVKWATFEGTTLKDSGRWKSGTGKWKGVGMAAICASGDTAKVVGALEAAGIPHILIDNTTPLPIELDYRTPATLGPDRIAAACGAWGIHPGEASIVIDAGTCITVDYLDEGGVYHGGAIMPGIAMSLGALHRDTAKLPLVDPDGYVTAHIPGRTTEESIIAGTLGATMLALAGYVTLYRQRVPQLHVMLTGGDAARLTAAGVSGWEHVENLTLRGINEILKTQNLKR